MKIKFTPSAKKQFLDAIEFIRLDNPQAAIDFRKKSESTLRRLEKFPNSGRKVPEFPELSYREVIIPPFRFFYRIVGSIIWIIAVWHGAQLPSEPES